MNEEMTHKSGTDSPKIYIVKDGNHGKFLALRNQRDADEYYSSIPGSIVHEIPLQESLGMKEIIYERRVRVSNCVVTLDRWTEEVRYSIDGDRLPDSIDIETYESTNGDWNIVVIGPNRERVNEAADFEIEKL